MSSVGCSTSKTFLGEGPVPGVISVPSNGLEGYVPFRRGTARSTMLSGSKGLMHGKDCVSGCFLRSSVPSCGTRRFDCKSVAGLAFGKDSAFIVATSSSIGTYSKDKGDYVSFLGGVGITRKNNPSPPRRGYYVLKFSTFFKCTKSRRGPLFIDGTIIRPLPKPSKGKSVMFAGAKATTMEMEFRFACPSSKVIRFRSAICASPKAVAVPCARRLSKIGLIVAVARSKVAVKSNPNVRKGADLSFVICPPARAMKIAGRDVGSLVFGANVLVPSRSFSFGVSLFRSGGMLLRSSFPSKAFSFSLIESKSLRFSKSRSFACRRSRGGSMASSRFRVDIATNSSTSFMVRTYFVDFLGVYPRVPFFLGTSYRSFPMSGSRMVPCSSPCFRCSVSKSRSRNKAIVMATSLSSTTVKTKTVLKRPGR